MGYVGGLPIKREKEKYVPLPYHRMVRQADIDSVYKIIKKDIQDTIELVLEDVLNDPEREHMVVKRH